MTFGIRLKIHKKQILIIDKKGNPPPYKNLYDDFRGKEMQITKSLLEAANKPIGDQPSWEDEGVDDGIQDSMRWFSVISQIAEGARPSKEFFDEINKWQAKRLSKTS